MLPGIRTLSWMLVSGGLGIVTAQTLANRTLVVYTAGDTDSQTVADFYRSQRAIPPANVCPVAFPNPGSTVLNFSDWTTTVRPTIQSCLNAVGRTQVLYIVLSYRVPHILARDSPPGQGAVASYIADIWDGTSGVNFPAAPSGTHRYFANVQTQGNVYPPFQTLAAYRLTARVPLIYSVWHLFGTSVAGAEGLVSRALVAESAGGLSGNAYIDRRYGDSTLNFAGDSGFVAGDQDLERAALMFGASGVPLVKDTNFEEFGTAPAAPAAPDAAWYSGWYSYNNYNDVFTWRPGAIGWHLDSASAFQLGNPASTSWVSGALNRNITVTAGSVTEPFLEGLPRPDVVFRHLLQGGNVGDAFLRGTAWLKWMILFIGDPLYRPFPSGTPAAFANEPSLSLAASNVIGGSLVNFTMTLPSPAGLGGQVVNLSHNNPGTIATLPTTVTIPAGQTATTATLITTSDVPEIQYGVITASYASTTLRNTIGAFPVLAQVSTAPAELKGGSPGKGTVFFYTTAPLGGGVVELMSSHPSLLQVPASVSVSAGTVASSFTFTTNPVGANTAVTITASYRGSIRTVNVSLLP